MSALSKLLAKVAIRAIRKSNTEAELTDVADKVITWSNASLITEQHVDAIANSMEEDVDGVVEAVEESIEEPTEEPEITEDISE